MSDDWGNSFFNDLDKFTEEDQGEAVIENCVICNLDGFDDLTREERVESLDDAIHQLNFERRLASLTEAQLNHMSSGNLSKAQLERLGNCENDEDRENVFDEYCRADYFKQCAWSDYLNGVTDKPPLIDSEQL